MGTVVWALLSWHPRKSLAVGKGPLHHQRPDAGGFREKLEGMTVLIAGCGDLGTQAGLYFAAAGEHVVGWRRSPHLLPAEIQGVAVDLTETVPALPEETDVVVVPLTAGSRTVAAYRATYYNGVANLLDAIERDGTRPRRIIFVSSTAVYGEDDGSWIDADTVPRPSSPTGTVLRETEQMLAERAPNAVLLRLAGVYGPGRTRLIDQVRKGSTDLEPPPHWTNRIHRDDAARAIVHLAGLEDFAPAYLGSDDEPALLADVQRFLAAELDLQHASTDKKSDDDAATGKRCNNSLLRASGFVFTYPTYREGYRAVLRGEGVRHQ